MALLDDLTKALHAKAGFEQVESTGGQGSQLRLVGRVPANMSSHWTLMAHHLLQVMDGNAWKVDISRMYFLRQVPSGKKMFYAWRLIFQAPKLEDQLQSILGAVMTVPQPSRVEIQEFPLAGARTHRNSFGSQGGYAGSVLNTPVGPAAIAAKAGMMGGR